MPATINGVANSAGLRCHWTALVRLLWRGCASRAQQRQAAVAHERRPAVQGNRQKPLQDNETIAAAHIIALGNPRLVWENTADGVLD